MAPVSGHLLAVSWCMPPALFPRSIQVARTLKGLNRIGWTSHVITPSPQGRADTDPMDDELARTYASNYDTIPIDLSTADPDFGSFLDRWRDRIARETHLTRDQLWVKRASSAARRFVRSNKVDVLVTFAQPWSDHLIGLDVSRWRPRLTWVAHFSDPWVDSLYETDRPDDIKQRDRMLETEVVERASAVVFTNQYASDLVMKKYPDSLRRKARVVPHTTDNELLQQFHARPRPVHECRPFRLSHVGNLFAGVRRAKGLFEALAMLNRRRPLAGQIEVVFLGAGSGLYEAREKVFELALEGIVRFCPRVPHLASLAAMAESDVLVLIDAPAQTNVFLPSKVVDYLMANRPILALTPSAGSSAEIMRHLGYPIVEPDNAGQIAEALEALLLQHVGGTLRPSEVANTHARQFSLEETSGAFAKILDQVRPSAA